MFHFFSYLTWFPSSIGMYTRNSLKQTPIKLKFTSRGFSVREERITSSAVATTLLIGQYQPGTRYGHGHFEPTAGSLRSRLENRSFDIRKWLNGGGSPEEVVRIIIWATPIPNLGA